MPLTRKVRFEAVSQRCNMFQVPKLIRWQFKLEPNQVLKVSVSDQSSPQGWHDYFSKMTKNGRIRIPKLLVLLFKGEKPNLSGHLLDITLEPAPDSNQTTA